MTTIATTTAPCGHPICEPHGGQCLIDGRQHPRIVESVNEGQLRGQLRIGGEDVRAEITEDFFLTQTAPAPRQPEPAPIPQPGFWDDAEVIHTYSRADAIRDGVLIDVSTVSAEAGIVWPVAMTAAAHADTVTWTEADERRKPYGTGQDEAGRLWDVLTMTAFAMRAHARHHGADVTAGTRVRVTLVRIPREGRGVTPRKVELHAHVGPGDTAAPVITLMLPNED